jgi:hypothetical protein
MSSSPADSDDMLGRADPSLRFAKDGGLLTALSSVPDYSLADPTSHSVDRKSDSPAQPAAASALPLAGEGRAAPSDVKRSDTIVYVPPKRQIPPFDHGDEIPPFGLSPASVSVMSNRGYVGLGKPTSSLDPREEIAGYERSRRNGGRLRRG